MYSILLQGIYCNISAYHAAYRRKLPLKKKWVPFGTELFFKDLQVRMNTTCSQQTKDLAHLEESVNIPYTIVKLLNYQNA